MKPKLRFPEFADAWIEKSIGEIATISRGRFSPRPRNDPRYYGGKTEFIQTSEVVGANPIIKNGIKTLNEEGIKVSKVFPSETIVMTIDANIGYVGFANRPVAFPDSLVGISAFNDTLPKYLFYILSRKQRRLDYIAEEAAQKNITTPTVRNFKIWLSTNQEEQVAISNLIDLINLKINLLNKKKQALEVYKKGLMQKIFTQELRFKREDGTDYPEWYTNKLGEISSIIKGQQLNRDSMVEHGTIPVLNGGISWSGYTSTSNTPSDSITISEGGNSCGYVSFVHQPFWSGGHNYSLRLNPEYHVRYLYHYLKYSEPSIMKLRVGSGLPNIQKKDISKFNCLLPSLEEQMHIANFLDAVDGQISIHKELVLRTEGLKKGLLQQMFV